jgi:hypothetical protein
MERHKESSKSFSEELLCSDLSSAMSEAKKRVMDSDHSVMLQADACSRNRSVVRTRYRCWIDERGAFHERSLG